MRDLCYRLGRALVFLCALAGGMFLIIASPGGTGGGTATTGSIQVTIEFGAGGGGGTCTGSGSVTIKGPAPSMAQQTLTYAFSGIAGNSFPACSTGVVFSSLQPGSWTVTDSSNIACGSRTVTVGQMTGVTLRTDVGSCT